MTFSRKELSAIIKTGMVIAACDGHVAEEEITAIAIECAKFGLTAEEAKNYMFCSMEGTECISVMSIMTVEQKKYACAFFAVVIAADGKILDSEVKMWTFLSKICSFPTMTIQEGLVFWANN